MLSSSNEPTRELSAPGSELVPGSFAELGLSDGLLRALKRVGYTQPTPIQIQAIPPAVDGRDVLGCARTGTGKTAGFVLPLLQRLLVNHPRDRAHQRVRALILAPTRELAAQIGESVAAYGAFTRLSHLVIFGGVSQERQVKELVRGVDIVVATPGRLVDLMQQDLIRLSEVETLVLDEFDRMLDQGFLPSVRKVVSALPEHQTLLFSATAPKEIEQIAKQLLRNPVRVAVDAQSTTPTKVDQSVWFVDSAGKRELLQKLVTAPEVSRALVFTRTKHGADRVARHLDRAGVAAEAIHGNKSQNNRQRTLNEFRDGDVRVLVATDVAARGLDIEGVTHVINYELPADPENYVHRIGRTARAGKTGVAISLCSADERAALTRIEKTIGKALEVRGGSAASLTPSKPPVAPGASASSDAKPVGVGSAVPRPRSHRARSAQPPRGR